MEASGRRTVLLAVLALAVPVSAALVATPVNAEGEDDPHLLVRIENERSETGDVNVTVDGPRSWARDASVGAGGRWERQVPGPAGEYEVRVQDQETGSFAILAMDNTGCQGPYLLTFQLEAGGSVDTGDTGCLGETVRFEALIEEATQARDGTEGDPVEIPHPRDRSEGRFLIWGRLAAPDWAEAAEMPFRWLPDQSFPDRWGRQVEGTELVYQTPYGTMSAGANPLFTSSSSSLDTQDRIRYRGDAWRPVSTTGAVSTGASVSLAQAASEVKWAVEYRPDPGFRECLYRNPLQNTSLAPGQTLDDPLCPSLIEGEQETWWTGSTEQIRGFEAVPLYGVDDPDDPASVVKTVWADGLAYPFVAELMVVDEEGTDDRHRAANLTHLTEAGSTPEARPTADPAPQIPLDPLHPLGGPALDDRHRVPFPLDEASQAAREDPTLMSLQGLTDGETALAAAALGVPEGTDAGDARELAWTLAYTTPTRGPVLVECRKAGGQVAGQTVTEPAPRCREVDEPPRYARQIRPIPHIGPESLPARAIAWDVALDRQAVLDPANASEPINVATYRPALPEQLERPAYLAVGTEGDDPEPGPIEGAQVPTTTSVDLSDGSTLVYRTGTKTVSGLSDPGGALSPAETAEPSPSPTGMGIDAELVAGAAASAGLLALLLYLLTTHGGLAGLFTRLTREEVLEHPTREEIRHLVEADPGIHGRAISRQVDTNDHTVDYHVRRLVREGILSTLERGGYTHYFLAGEHPPGEMQRLATLKRGRTAEVLEEIEDDPGLGISEIADRVDISKSYASKLVDQLVEDGIVDKVRQGRTVALYENQ